MTAKVPFAVSAIRTLARDRAEKSSLRSVAAEIPMSLTAFRHFLKGGKPQPATLEKLIRWYAETKHGSADIIADEDVQAAIALLQLYIARASSEKDIAKRRATIVAVL